MKQLIKKKLVTKMGKKVRHVLGLSGGKDSAALAVLLHKQVPQMEYFYCDTHKELPETYEFLDKLRARLGIKITTLCSETGFDHWLEVYNGYLPSPRMRWCTRMLKIIPFEQFVGDDDVISYVGIREDENRLGYLSTKPNIRPIYPFITKGDKDGKAQNNESTIKCLENEGINLDFKGYIKEDIENILEESGIGMPEYYKWRSRSGCYFCFFQRKYEWVMLAEKHPELFEQAMKYEQDHSDGRSYNWVEGETLTELIARKDKIIADHNKNLIKNKSKNCNSSLFDILSKTLDEDDDREPCLICHL